TAIAPHVGITEDGVEISRLEITTPKAVLTISNKRKMTTKKSMRPRLPMQRPESRPIDWPRWRCDAHKTPMSCMPAAKTVPSVTHKNAGNQPQITATAEPIMGAAPATEVKWCPHRKYLLVGKKTKQSSME